MKSVKLILILFVTLCSVILFDGWSQQKTDIGGFWEFNQRFLTNSSDKGIPYQDIYSRLRLKLHSDISDYVSAEVSMDTRLYGKSNQSLFTDLSSPSGQYPIDILLWEAYLDIYDLGIDGLDLRIGKQRIAWGTADGINPTDNINPNDFSDLLNFTDHIPSLAIKLEYSIFEYLSLETIWAPSQKPSLLPQDNAFFLSQNNSGNQQNMITALFFDQPSYDLSHSVGAIKLKGTLFNIDYSLSYLHGYDPIPYASHIDIYPDQEDPTKLHQDITMGLFKQDVVGADLAGELYGIGWWIETALFFVGDDVSTKIKSPDPSNPQNTITNETNKIGTFPYYHLVAGFDYNFSWNMYLNLQYAHGLFGERGDENNINDYLFLRLEEKLFREKLKITLISGIAILDWQDVGNNYGWILSPDIEWIPYDSTSIMIGAFYVGSKGPGFFDMLKDLDMVYIKAKVDF